MMAGVAGNDQQDQPQGQPGADSTFFNVEETARKLGVHPGTVRKAISGGRLKSTLIYGRVVVSSAELERYRAATYPDGVPRRGRPRSASGPAPEDT